MARIRILMLGWEFPPFINGGLGVACEGLANALATRSKLVLFLPKIRNFTKKKKVQIIPINHLTHSADFEPYLDANPSEGLYGRDLDERVEVYSREAIKASRETHFDVIHAHDWLTAIAALKIRKQSGKPLIFHVHSLSYDRAGPDEQGRIYNLEKQALQKADRVIAVSHYTKKICINYYNADPEKISVVHNGISPIAAYRRPKPFLDHLVVFLGRMTQQKGPSHFLEIALKVLSQNSNIRFVLAGTGDQLQALMAKSIRLGIADRCHFTGFLGREKIHNLLSMADVYCMPSVSEPFGLSALEAAQFGVPTVISKQSGAAEILTEAETIDAFDTEQMARGILKQLEMGILGKPLPIRDWEDVASDVVALYGALLNRPT